MDILKEIFRRTKFDDNENILVPFEEYFNEENRSYCKFSLDDNDIPALLKFGKSVNNKGGEVFVSIYGYELTKQNGCGFAYGDSLWITGFTEDEKELLSMLHDVAEPSCICPVETITECRHSAVWTVCFSENEKDILKERRFNEFTGRTVCLYWD